MPDRPCFYFCRACGYRGQFVAGEKDVVPCPQCHDHGRDESIMVRQDVEWAKNTGANTTPART